MVQYDNLAASLGFNSRVRWTGRPGSDGFFVVNHGWLDDGTRFHPQVTEVTLKAGGNFRR